MLRDGLRRAAVAASLCGVSASATSSSSSPSVLCGALCEARRYMGFNYPVPRKLREVVKMPLFEREDPISIKLMWLEQFKSNPRVVTDALMLNDYERLKQNFSACPMFIAPLVRPNEAFVTLVMQVQDGKHVLMTALHDFQTKGAAAPPHVILTVFDELFLAKGVALLRADLVSPSLERADGERLLQYIRAAYLDANMFAYVQKFNHSPRNFDFNEFQQKFKQYFVLDRPDCNPGSSARRPGLIKPPGM